MMGKLLGLVLLAARVPAEPWPLERLFTRPFVWGTSPEKATWSKQKHTLVFLWNAEGRRFLDLYAYHPDQNRLVRLTQLESIHDDINRGEAEKDERRRQYLMPTAGLSGFDLSNDGSVAAFAHDGDLYIVSTDGQQPPLRLTKTKAAESSPRLSPDGAKLAFTRDGQLFVQDLRKGQLTQITDIEGSPAKVGEYRWSPDGKRFLYTVPQALGRQLLLPNYSGRLVTTRSFTRSLAGDEPIESRTYIVSSEGGAAKPVDTGPWGAREYSHTPEWSPDSSSLVQQVIHPNFKQRQIRLVNPNTGRVKILFEETDDKWVEPSFLVWAADSHQVLFTSERDGWSHLYKVSTDGGEPRQLTQGHWQVYRDFLLFSPDPQWIGDYIYYTSTEGGPSERHFFRIHQDGSEKKRLSSREGLNIGLMSADGEHTALLLADLNHPFDLYVGDRRITTSPRPEFTQYPWPRTRFAQFPSRVDRKPVAAKILLPPGYELENRAQKRPAVLFIHGSGLATSVLKQWGSYQEFRYVFNCYLANKGYVILDIDYRGSAGYGRDWRTGVYLHMGGPDLEDVLGGVDYLRSLGNIDMTRVGIWGVSYGGFMTNMAMFRSPETFRTGASWAAVNDWENYNAFYTGQRLTTPQQNPEAYHRSSPIHFSGGLKNPLLIVHGIVDDNVLFQDSVQLTEKLIHEGKDFSQIYYPEESHGFVRDETLIDAFRRTAGWMDRYLR
jgi:dipeptidyl aminopeptidase/acylaminoacyl peptidase